MGQRSVGYSVENFDVIYYIFIIYIGNSASTGQNDENDASSLFF